MGKQWKELLTTWDIEQRQSLPLKHKITLSQERIKQWYDHWEGRVFVSFSGGKDSTVLLHLVRSVYPDTPAVFVNTGMEFPEILDFVKGTENVTWVRPEMTFRQVIDDHGYPVISKEQAYYIWQYRNTGSEKLKKLRWEGADNGSGKYKISEKWKYLVDAPFKISAKCCDILKKNPLRAYQRETGCYPYVGTMAGESNARMMDYKAKGCNLFDGRDPISRPIAFWLEEDVYAYVKKLGISISPIYAMGYKRTGCIFCAFGVHMQKGENRFDQLRRTHPKKYKYCMENLGMREVLKFVGSPVAEDRPKTLRDRVESRKEKKTTSETPVNKRRSVTNEDLRARRELPLKHKITMTKERIEEWYKHWEGMVYVSFSGGKDSIVLLHLTRSMFPEVPAVYFHTGMEFPEVIQLLRATENVEWVRPKMTFKEVIEKHGYPVVSKEQSQFIYEYRHYTDKMKKMRWEGVNGSYKISEKWKFLVDAPFEISHRCCDILKKNPAKVYERRSGRKPIMGLRTEDSRLRTNSYLRYGCNAFDVNRPRSTPMAFWSEENVWAYIKEHNLSYPTVYDMGWKSTGCLFCAFGCHTKEGKERFKLLKKTHPKKYDYCMDNLGMRKILEYVGVPLADEETLAEKVKKRVIAMTDVQVRKRVERFMDDHFDELVDQETFNLLLSATGTEAGEDVYEALVHLVAKSVYEAIIRCRENNRSTIILEDL